MNLRQKRAIRNLCTAITYLAQDYPDSALAYINEAKMVLEDE